MKYIIQSSDVFHSFQKGLDKNLQRPVAYTKLYTAVCTLEAAMHRMQHHGLNGLLDFQSIVCVQYDKFICVNIHYLLFELLITWNLYIC